MSICNLISKLWNLEGWIILDFSKLKLLQGSDENSSAKLRYCLVSKNLYEKKININEKKVKKITFFIIIHVMKVITMVFSQLVLRVLLCNCFQCWHLSKLSSFPAHPPTPKIDNSHCCRFEVCLKMAFLQLLLLSRNYKIQILRWCHFYSVAASSTVKKWKPRQ